jgi:hypothetical protein
MAKKKQAFVNVALSTRPNDSDITVGHLGVFPNGQESEVAEDQVAHWERSTGRQWPKGGVLEVNDDRPAPQEDEPPVSVEEEDTGPDAAGEGETPTSEEDE